MITIEKKREFSRNENFAILIAKDFDLSVYFTSREKMFIETAIANDKQFIHINRYQSQAYVIVIADKKEEWQIKELIRRKGAELSRSLNALKEKEIYVADFSEQKVYGQALLEGLYLGSYQFLNYYKDAEKKINTLVDVDYQGLLTDEELLENTILWQSVCLTKTLINEPVMSLPSTSFVAEITAAAQKHGFAATAHAKKWLEQQGMGGILAVNKGSIDPPYFCILEWKPKDATNTKPIVLVGKGVMYDTGGLSLKPSTGMETMKADMSGASAVLGVMSALSANKISKHVIALIPITDNRPSGNAYDPGDVVKMHDGTFVEVLNTDAEGRMLLADALSYAKIYDPELVINIATLTGAANAAVGENAAAVMGTAPQDVIQALMNCGFDVHERLVQFPLWDDYADLIKSDIADLKNVGGPLAGAITAGKFLQHFTAYPWIHIDIAGSAYHPKGGDYRGKGATGMGVRLLYSFLKNN
jgi:leucyl aminopeptidase